MIRTRMQAAQDRQKYYADASRRQIEFSVGDHVWLKVSPTRGVRRFGVRGKLSPRYIGPYEILERVGDLAYRLALPPALAGIHDVFHISQLRACVPGPDFIVPIVDVQVQKDLTYEESPVRLLERSTRKLRGKEIPMVKVQWSHHDPREATWETETSMREHYPSLFESESRSSA